MQRYKNILNITKNNKRNWCKTLFFACFYHNDMRFSHNFSVILFSHVIYITTFFLLKTGCTYFDLFIFAVHLKRQNRKIIVVFSVNLCFLMLSMLGFLVLLFLICFFCHFIFTISIDYQYIISNQ